MKLGAVIGRVTLSQTVAPFLGARWLVVSPLTCGQYARAPGTLSDPGPEPSLIVYDNLGGGEGQTIGYVDGREAAQPFAQPTPIDAINVALVDEIFYCPCK